MVIFFWGGGGDLGGGKGICEGWEGERGNKEWGIRNVWGEGGK